MGIKAWYPPDYDCHTNIESNPDIGGIGVLLSFVITSWITVLVAGIPALQETIERNPTFFRKKTQNENGNHDPETPNRSLNNLSKKCNNLLGPLCDLQAITSIAIITAGWTQIPTIDYYHQDLLIAYWWLTLNSFWAGRANFLDLDAEDEWMRLVIRRVTILCSCVLGLSFQGYVVRRENKAWVDGRGHCDLYIDGSSAIPWMVGVGVFGIALFSTFFGWSRGFIKAYFESIGRKSRWLKDWCEEAYEGRQESISAFAGLPAPRHQVKWFVVSLKLAFAWISRCTWNTLVLWLAVWSYGDGFGLIVWIFYVLFTTWNTFDVISLWKLNQVLLDNDDERHIKSFGQVLPLVLMLSIVFSAVDVGLFRKN